MENKPIEKNVNNCNDCPFLTFGGWEGEHSECGAKKNKRIPATKKLFGKIVETPSWCPLKKSGILVKLSDNV